MRILFVCHGNICRSPMAEFVMKDIVRRNHLENRFEIASAATSREELGNPVYENTLQYAVLKDEWMANRTDGKQESP